MNRAKLAAEKNGLAFQTLSEAPPLFIDPQSDFVSTMLKLANRKKSQTVCYGTDGAMFSELKNRIICGPGDIAQAHTKEEFISLEQLEKGAQFYQKTIEHFCIH